MTIQERPDTIQDRVDLPEGYRLLSAVLEGVPDSARTFAGESFLRELEAGTLLAVSVELPGGTRDEMLQWDDAARAWAGGLDLAYRMEQLKRRADQPFTLEQAVANFDALARRRADQVKVQATKAAKPRPKPKPRKPKPQTPEA